MNRQTLDLDKESPKNYDYNIRFDNIRFEENANVYLNSTYI